MRYLARFWRELYIIERSSHILNNGQETCSFSSVKVHGRSKQSCNLWQDLSQGQISRGATNPDGLRVAGDNPVLASGIPVAKVASGELEGNGSSAAWEDLQVVEATENTDWVSGRAKVDVLNIMLVSLWK
jgi:hypothetical protein